MTSHRTMPGRRALMRGAASLAAGGVAGGVARAQGVAGGRPSTLFLPYAPSGGQEVISRILLDALAARFGGTFVAEPRPGAGTTLAARHVARARPDGTALLLGTNVTFSQAEFAYREPGYDPDRDFTHLGLLAEALYLVTANPRWESLEAVAAEARRRPGRLAFTSWGIGSVAHLLGVDFCRRQGIDMIHVPFSGTAPAVTEVVAGRADVIFCIVSSCLPFVESGQLRAVATPSPRRIPGFPGVPTMVELGHDGFETLPWFSLSGPANMPPPLAAALEETTRAAFAAPDAGARLARLGLVPAARGAADMRARIIADRAVSGRLMRQAGIEPQ